MLLPRLRHHPLILPRPNILQRPLEMPARGLQTRVGFPVVRLQVRVDQLDQPVQVLGRDRLVLLVEVVHVAVQDLDEELHGDGRVHAGVGDAERALEAFEDALAVAVELFLGQYGRYGTCRMARTFFASSSPL